MIIYFILSLCKVIILREYISESMTNNIVCTSTHEISYLSLIIIIKVHLEGAP